MAIIEPDPSYRVSPISPAEAKAKRVKSIPSQMISIVNDLLVANLSQLSDKRVEARVTQRDILDGITSNHALMEILLKEADSAGNQRVTHSYLESVVFRLGWLDFEDTFELAGWTVKYDKPSIGDSYPAYFKFTSKE